MPTMQANNEIPTSQHYSNQKGQEMRVLRQDIQSQQKHSKKIINL